MDRTLTFFLVEKLTISPYINRFLQPDSIIPNLYNPQNLNRFSYVRNSPLRYSDPTGHMECAFCDGEGGNLTPLQKAIDAQKLAVLEYEAERRKSSKKSEETSEESHYWDVAGDLESCNGNWGCIETIMGWYYDDLGYPLDQLAMNPPFQNPLGPKDLYFLEPSILMEMQNSENTRLLQILNVDYSYPYNYDPVYLDALRNNYPELNSIVENESNWFSESGTAAHEFIYSPDGYSWVTKYASGWEFSLWQLNKVKYMRLVIDGD